MNLYISLSSKYNNKTIDMNSENIKYRPETMTSLAGKYGVTLHTLRNWIKIAGINLDYRRKSPLTPAQIKLVVDKVGPF